VESQSIYFSTLLLKNQSPDVSAMVCTE